jgi:MFS family permease
VSRPPHQRLPGRFWRLWWAGAVSNLGDGVLVAALPLLAVRATGDRLSVGLVSTFVGLPWLLFALPVGAWLDRVDRRRAIVLADTFRALLVAGLAVVAGLGELHIWMLWVLAFGLGLGEVVADSASQALLPQLVEHDQLDRANGLRQAAEVAGNTFLGIPLGGVLFAAVAWLPLGFDAASFAVAAVLVASLRGRFRPHAASRPHRGWRAEMASGFRFLRRNHLLRHLVVVLTLLNLAFAAGESTFVLYATELQHLGDRGFALLLALVGAGSIGAGIAGGWLVGRMGRRFAILVASFTPALTMAGVGILPRVWWVVPMLAVQAAMITIWSVVAVTLRQRLVPQQLFGRVNAVYRWCSWGAAPLGAFLGAATAHTFGLRAPWFLGSGLVLLAALLATVHLRESVIRAALDAVPTPPSPTDDTPVHLDQPL